MYFIDQLERKIKISSVPKRIVSLVPSQTELLHYLGLEKEIIGITKFCIYPKSWRKEKQKIGGTKDFKIEFIRSLSPDLIIGNKEENTKEGLEELALTLPVWISDVKNVNDALEMIQRLGLILNRNNEADALVLQIQKEKIELETFDNQLKCIYLIWQKPFMTVGGDTYINEMLNIAGFKNVFANLNRYPELTIEQIKDSDADYVFLSSEPFPFKVKHKQNLEKLTGKKVLLVDGEAFSWYGNRILYSFKYFRKLHFQIQQRF